MIVKWTKYLFIIFISILISSSFGIAQNIRFEKITVEDGLSNSLVNCLLQDRTGFIWFGTDDGLNRYDGYEIKVYRNNPDDSNSISDNIIWSLFEDHAGYLWIGTKNGKLNRYDPIKNKFENWYLDSNLAAEINITCITEDRINNIWIGTYKNGLYRYNQSQNKFDHWQNEYNAPKILSSNFITSILEDEDANIWVSTYAGLNKFNPDSLQSPFTQFLKDSSDWKSIFNVPVWHLSKSSCDHNSIWVGKLDGLVKIDPQKINYSLFSLPAIRDLPFANSVSSVVEETFAGDSILWVGTYGGLVRLNLATGEKKRFVRSKKNNSGLLSNTIHDLIIDKSGVVWIATENGINYYSPKHSKFNFHSSQISIQLESQNLLNANIRAITQTDDEKLWFGTDGGLFGIKRNTELSTHIQNVNLSSLNVWSLSGGNSGSLWIGTYGQGLKELDVKTNKLKPWSVENPVFNTSPYHFVKSVLQDEKGMLWIGFWGGGLARLNPNNKQIDHWRHETNNPLSLSYNDVWVLHQDSKGRIWIGTNGGGLNLFNEKVQNSFYNWRSNRKNKSGLSSDNIYSVCESINGNKSIDMTVLWIGTANGLNKFVIKNEEVQQNYSKPDVKIEYYTVDNGLPDNAVESILEDKNGNLWLGTSSGISFFNVEEEKFTNYSLADGLNGNTFNSSAAFKSEDGIMFFGGTTGLNYFVPERIKQSIYSPPVLITDFQLFNQPVIIADDSPLKTSIYYTKEITLDYNQDVFSFQFASIDYNSTRSIQYAYRMDDFDKDWIYSGSRRFVTYTNLDPGQYIFRVKATNADGVWNETETHMSIIINPPIWATWWAYSVYMLFFISVLVSVRSFELNRRRKKEDERLRREREDFLLREAKLKAITIEKEKEIEKQKIRNRIAQDLHDEIGSNLSSISLMSDLIQKTEKPDPESIEKIKRIHKVAKDSSQAMRDIVWITNSTSDNLKDLVAKMNEVANDMLGGIKWNFNSPQKYPETPLAPETKRNVFFIYKELLNNIIKHSNAGNVIIKLKISERNLFLAVKDDGKGFKVSPGFSGNGLKNMQNRAKEINGILKLSSIPGKGTALALAVNITQVRD